MKKLFALFLILFLFYSCTDYKEKASETGTKISALTALAEAPATDDVIAIVDTSAVETKKITIAYLLSQLPAHTTGMITITPSTAFLAAAGDGAIGMKMGAYDTDGPTLTELAQYLSGSEPYLYLGGGTTNALRFDSAGNGTLIGTGNINGVNATEMGYLATVSANVQDALDAKVPKSAFTQDSGVLVGTGAGTYAEETGATLRTSLGLGTGDSPQFTGIELSHATDNTLTASGGILSIESVAIPLSTDAKLNRYHQTAFVNPDALYADYNAYVEMDAKTAAALTISEIYVRLNEDPTNELTITCYQKTAGIDRTSPTTIHSGDTSAGVLTLTSSWTDNTVPSGSMIWCLIGDDPDATTIEMSISITGTYD